MNNLQMKIAMIGDEDFEDPRSKFFEWLLELGEPLFTYLKDEFGIEKMTVVGIPMLIILIIGIKRKLREDKNLFTIVTLIIGIMAFFTIVFLIIFGQVTHSP